MGWLRKLIGVVVVLGGAGAVAGWALSAPVRLDAAAVAQLSRGDAAKGKRIFNA
ncbi:MAG: cytochrome C, partial [Mesorhizobium sp.]